MCAVAVLYRCEEWPRTVLSFYSKKKKETEVRDCDYCNDYYVYIFFIHVLQVVMLSCVLCMVYIQSCAYSVHVVSLCSYAV